MADPASPAAADTAYVQVPGTAIDSKDEPIVQIRKFQPRDLKEVRLLLGTASWSSLRLPTRFVQPCLLRAPHASSPRTRGHDVHPFLLGAAPASVFWVVIQKNLIGLVAVDTYQPESGLKSIEELVKEAEEEQAEQAEESKGKKEKGRKDAKGEKEEKKKLDPTKLGRVPPPTEPTIALVRHFHMDAPYPPTFIQNDLLAHGLSKAFAIPSVHTAYFRVSKLTPWLEEVSKTMGMKKCPGPLGEELAPEVKGSRRGVQGWREWWVGVGREEWEKRYEEMRELHGL
ncbi:hypothetical protein CALVIDRAFT_567373 [Calocera viscosa TUFC12733]|uniref:N-acetyltransferase domain-containing protein n=1 Tax=Calocera viscosa (strain TUFC12733) TaxID=1330018 RepID=A0A167ICT3_CALVF|nr:hypothetical protein CALVIDRAFT_567373 [Calocera viscosa TUFC12733]